MHGPAFDFFFQAHTSSVEYCIVWLCIFLKNSLPVMIENSFPGRASKAWIQLVFWRHLSWTWWNISYTKTIFMMNAYSFSFHHNSEGLRIRPWFMRLPLQVRIFWQHLEYDIVPWHNPDDTNMTSQKVIVINYGYIRLLKRSSRTVV